MSSPKPATRAPEGDIRSLISALQANPLELGKYCLLAKAFATAGEFQKAEFTLRRALDIDPLYADAWLELGAVSSILGEWAKSVNAYERACALQPANLSAWVGYAIALIANQDVRRAAETHNTLLQRFPVASESHLISGHISKVRGEFAEASDSYRRAIDIDPLQTEAIFNLVDIAPPTTSDPFTKRLERLAGDDSFSPRQKTNLSFALARIYERAGEVARAFAAYEQANSALDAMLRSLGLAYDRQALEEDTDGIINLFGADIMARPLEPLDLDLKVIFIVGLPRSGTTLVEKILGENPHVSVGGELPFMQECLAALMANVGGSGSARRFSLGDDNGRRLLARLRERYLDGLFERELDAEFVTDKLPANFRAVGLIRLLFPDALIVHCVRDPIATCWSLYTAHLGMHAPYYTSLERLAHYYNRVYSRLIAHWRSVLPGAIIDVRYEDLVRAPQDTIAALLQGCGIPRESTSEVARQAQQPIFTASMIQARQPIYPTSVFRWKPYAKYLAPLVESLQLDQASR
jgi:tetratricopeptide (TPR) repeat protein